MPSFRAQELHSDGSFRTAGYTFKGSARDGWVIEREGRRHLELPVGYRLLRTLRCGICATDQARVFLPFPLPQIIGHEVIAEDESGRTAAAEINASHHAVGSPAASECPFCSSGLHTHCPERMVLGIDRLPGGFGPFILVPGRNVVPVPKEMPLDTSVLVEPFAAALHAVESLDLGSAASAAVLGAGRLGLLVTAALRAVRDASGGSFSITVVEPDPIRAEKARQLGADTVIEPGREADTDPNISFDVVVESTGGPEGLENAVRLARREVHVKSTTGRETMGLRHLTEMVVDEVALMPFSREAVERLASGGGRTAVLLGKVGKTVNKILDACGLAVHRVTREDLAARGGRNAIRQADVFGLSQADVFGLSQADVVIVTSLEDTDLALRPRPGIEHGLVRPRGTILVEEQGRPAGLLAPLFAKEMRITTSRCGDFMRAFPVMKRLLDEGVNLGEILVTRRLPAGDIAAALAAAREPGSIKVVVEHASRA